MNKKAVSMTLVSCFAVMALASCSGRGEIKIPDVNVLTYDEIKDKEIKITFWESFGQTPEAALIKQVDKFMELYPNIEVEVTSKGGYPNLKKAVSMEIPTGNTPNVVIGYPDHFAEYLSAGIVVPLNEYMDSTDPEIGIREGANNVHDDFFANYMTENQSFIDGYTFGLPFNKSTELAFYNKTVFTEFEVEVPTTWDEVKTAGETLIEKITPLLGTKHTCTKPGNEGKVLDFSAIKDIKDVRPITYDSKANAFITLTKDFGGTYTEMGDTFEEGYMTFNNDGTKNALNFLDGMYDDGTFGLPETWEKSYCSDVFKTLNSFYTIGSSAGSYHNVPKGDTFEVGVAPVPYHVLNGEAQKNVIQQGTNIAMLSNSSDEERMASWLLIRFLTSYQQGEANDVLEAGYDPNAEFAKEASYLPVRKSGVESKNYQKFINTDPVEAGLGGQDAAKIAAALKATEYGDDWNKFVDPAFIGSSEVREGVDRLLASVLMAGTDVQAAIDATYNELSTYTK